MSEVSPPPAATPVVVSSAHDGASVCSNCGRERAGNFCPACGQQRLHAGDLTLRHAWHHLVHELVHLDGKIFGSLKLLFTRPGQLTLDFLEGRRVRHVHPLRLFLVFGAIYFLVARISSPVDLRSGFEDNLAPEGRANLERAVGAMGLSLDQFLERANARLAPLFKSVYIGAVLVQGFWLWVLFRRRRPLLAENMVMILHMACFSMALWPLVGLAHLAGVSRWVTMSVLLGVSLAYFLIAGRRVYAAGWWRLTWSWMVLILSTTVIMGGTVQVVYTRVLSTARDAVAVQLVAEPGEASAVVPATSAALYDGRNLAGWVFVSNEATAEVDAVWAVVDGVIRCAGTPQGYLRTRGSYRDYVLRFGWRWTATPGNSGVLVHVNGADRLWPLCLEVQLRANDAGSLRTNGGATVQEVLPPATNPRQVSRRVPGTERPPGEWNEAEVICRGDTVTITINGVRQTEVTRASIVAGAIALQAEGAPIEFRGLEISPLASASGSLP